MQHFLDLISSYDANHPTFPPTEIYNEGWLLRIILNWFSGRGLNDHPLSFSDGSVWFSEALIPSPFLPRFRGDPLDESRTHTDYFLPLMDIIEIGSMSWEEILAGLGDQDKRASDSIGEFYARCLRFN